MADDLDTIEIPDDVWTYADTHRPTAGRALVWVPCDPETTAGGIVLPESVRDPNRPRDHRRSHLERALVLDVAPAVDGADEEPIEAEFDSGAWVLIDRHKCDAHDGAVRSGQIRYLPWREGVAAVIDTAA